MRKITYAQAIAEAVREEMLRDPRVIIMGEDVGLHGGVFRTYEGLFEEFGGGRVIDTPIAEGAFTGCGVGAAITGLRPIVDIMYIDFITLAMDQIVNQAAKMRYMFGGMVEVPLVIRTQGGAGRGNAGHHSQSFESWFVHVPGLKVVMPSNPYDAKGLLKSAIRDNNTVVFIDHKLGYFAKADVPDEEYFIPLGKADIKRSGRDITIVAISGSVFTALAAAKELSEKHGIEAEVIDPRTLKPLDMECIVQSVKKSHRLLIVHEACRTGGAGAEIASRVMEAAFGGIDAPITVLGGADTPIPYCYELEMAVLPQAQDILNKAIELCKWDSGKGNQL
ncbi:MAG: alpha-ketoacid dehydrogenase subunit beta [Planctomycetes bacterium]|nr:alpha-ketoacid dehydrogenase subunit beta [Planctomycetota bacterium]